MTQLIEARVRENMGPKAGRWREAAPVITFREGPTYSVEPQYLEEYHWLEATEPEDTSPEPEPEDAEDAPSEPEEVTETEPDPEEASPDPDWRTDYRAAQDKVRGLELDIALNSSHADLKQAIEDNL